MPNVPNTGNSLADFSLTAADLVHGTDGATAYSYAVANRHGGDPSLLIDLTSSTPYAYTDCNGWVNYALNSIAPLHSAVLSAARLADTYKVATFKGIDPDGDEKTFKALDESHEPFSRAFVLSDSFAAEPSVASVPTDTDGFAQVTNFATLQAGDVIAYATGIYADLSNHGLPITMDTGHTMIVTGNPVEIGLAADPTVSSIGGSDPVVDIYAVPIVDSSDVVHMQTGTSGVGVDDRPIIQDSKYYNYALSKADRMDAPAHSGTLHAGGLGTGTMWFAVDASGKAIAFKFNEHGSWQSAETSGSTAKNGLLIAAARLQTQIDLSLLPASALTPDGRLEVTLMPNRAESLVTAETESLTGDRGLLVDGSGMLTLSATSSFTGGIELRGTGLDLAATGAAGTGVISTDKGTANSIAIDAGTATVDGGGNDTITAAGGGSRIMGGQTLHFTGSGAATVTGGTGSATISGGAGGLYVGGSAGNNVIHAASGSSVWGGGAGDHLFGGQDDLLGAARGNTTLVGSLGDVLVDADGTFGFTGQNATVYGARSGSDVVAGTGDFTAVGRGGQTTVFGGSGTGTTWAGASHVTDVAGTGTGTLVAGSGESVLWINQVAGAQTVLALAGAGGGSVDVIGFRSGTDSVRTAGYTAAATQSVSQGSLTLTMADHTSITFLGVTSLG